MGSSVLDVFNDKYPSSSLIGCGPAVNLKIADSSVANNTKNLTFGSPLTTSAPIKNSYVPRSARETSQNIAPNDFQSQFPLK